MTNVLPTLNKVRSLLLIKPIHIIILISLLSLINCTHKPYSVQIKKGDAKEVSHQIYVISHGWHTAFVLPSRDIQAQIPALQQRFPDASYLTFGWGDEEVYQADQTTFLASTIAIMLPTNAVVHVVAHQQPPVPTVHTDVTTLCLLDNHYHALLRYIEHSFKHTADHVLMPTPLKDGENSQFYGAEGTYYFMNTCNNWTAKGLQSAGLDISPTFKFTAKSIMHYLRQNKPLSSPCPTIK